MLFAFTVLVLVADRLTKHYARLWLQGQPSVPVIPGILQFTYSENRGAAFGLLQDQRLLFIGITIVVVVGIFVFARQVTRQQRLERAALGMLLGGALGNLIDRISPGYVVDFIDFPYWPVFNIADSGIVVGAILVGITMYREMSEEQCEGDASPDA